MPSSASVTITLICPPETIMKSERSIRTIMTTMKVGTVAPSK